MPDAASPRTVDAHGNERYVVHSRLEITSILRSLIERCALVTVYFGEHDEFIVTSLLAINPDFEELIVDCGAEQVLNARLLESSRLTLETQLDHIRMQFAANRAEVTTFQQMPAFRIRLPEALIRLQRRENYRVKVPLSHHLTCVVPLDPRRADGTMRIRIGDVSGGGVALIDFPPSLELVPGTVYQDCQIDLGDIGRVTTDIEIVHVLEKLSRNNVRLRQCGCRFKNMPNAMLLLIQRYINKIDREQRALS